jgi:hypothetical protein
MAIWVFYRNRTGGFSRILSLNRYEQASFWSRNRDNVVVAIISSIVSVASPSLLPIFSSKAESNEACGFR